MKQKGKKKVSAKKKKIGLSFPLNWIVVCITVAFGLTIWAVGSIKPSQVRLVCANTISCVSDISGKIQPNQLQGIFLGKRVVLPKSLLADAVVNSQYVLGATTGQDKKIYVDLTNQRLYAFEGTTLVYNFLISSGWWNKTPTGTFSIWVKLRATRMTGGSGADYYDLPNVPYTMFFYNDQIGKALGYSLHGAYWHHRFGHPMSHGCINIEPSNAEKLYDWATPQITGYVTYATDVNPGTSVTIYGETPNDPPVAQ